MHSKTVLYMSGIPRPLLPDNPFNNFDQDETLDQFVAKTRAEFIIPYHENKSNKNSFSYDIISMHFIEAIRAFLSSNLIITQV